MCAHKKVGYIWQLYWICSLQAIKHKKPQPGLILHSDRGLQYTSKADTNLAKKHAIELSMSSTGNCFNNAVAESFFHTLKIAEEAYYTRNQATTTLSPPL